MNLRSNKVIAFEDCSNANLIVDAVYEGGSAGNAGDDPISRLLPGAGNQGGFRAAGSGADKKFVVLYTSGADPDWPDELDASTGQFTYYGDNKRPGHDLHDTARGGNALLRHAFGLHHSGSQGRSAVPPFFVFEKSPTPRSSKAVRFRGLAVPGYRGLPQTEDLVAVWKHTRRERFQNYKAIFTILDVPVVSRRWLHDLLQGDRVSSAAPSAWVKWSTAGRYEALVADPTRVVRTVEEQLPESAGERSLLWTVHQHFEAAPVAFEHFAADLFRMHDSRVTVDVVTRPSIDGGRDAIGKYVLGLPSDPVHVDFALEAKCYRPASDTGSGTTVGVKEMSRLISRLRHRQFGVLVTTSAVARQAYEEVRDDGHPILIISGGDIISILRRSGYSTEEQVGDLLGQYPVSGT